MHILHSPGAAGAPARVRGGVPAKCMHFGDLDDPNSEVSKLLAARPHHTLLPEAGTQPKVFYLR